MIRLDAVQLSAPIWKPFHWSAVRRLGENTRPPVAKVCTPPVFSSPDWAWAHISQPSPRVAGVEPHIESRTSSSRADQASAEQRQ